MGKALKEKETKSGFSIIVSKIQLDVDCLTLADGLAIFAHGKQIWRQDGKAVFVLNFANINVPKQILKFFPEIMISNGILYKLVEIIISP